MAAIEVELVSSPGHLLRRAQRVHTETWARLVSAPITGPQYAVLVAVAGWHDVDQRLAGELAAHDKSTAADIVGRLSRSGWIDRARDERDGRRWLLTLTEAAATSLNRLTSEAAAVQTALLAPLPEEEREDFVALLARIAIREHTKILEQPRGDTLQMARTPGYLLRRAQQVHGGLWTRQVPQLTGPQYAVLSAIAGAGALDHAGVGASASLDSSTVTELMRRLERRGWLSRAVDAADGRRWRVQVSVAGSEVLTDVRQAVIRVQDQLLEPLTGSETRPFLAMLQRVARFDHNHVDAAKRP